MISLLRESVAVLGRLRWLVLALVIALPLDSALQAAGWTLKRREQSGFRPPLPTYSVLATGASSAVGLYHHMGLGTATMLAALFVLIRFPSVHRWLKTNAQLGKRTIVVLPAMMLCAALTLLHPVLLRWEIQRGVRGEGGFGILTMTTLILLQGWFFACLAAFWQVALYPTILRAWSAQPATWRGLVSEPAGRWSALRTLHFIAFAIAVLVPAIAVRFRYPLPLQVQVALPSIVSALVFFPVILVPFGVVVRGLSIGRAIVWSFRALIAHFEKLLILLVPLALVFALLQYAQLWLGSITEMPQLAKICVQPLRGLLMAFGLVVGAQYFSRRVKP